MASLVETAKLNGVEPFAWLPDSLTMMVNDHPVNRLDDLLPWSGRAGYISDLAESGSSLIQTNSDVSGNAADTPSYTNRL